MGNRYCTQGTGQPPRINHGICQHLCDLSQSLDVPILTPQCLSQLGSDYTELPPTNVTEHNSDHCCTPTHAKSAQTGQWSQQGQAQTAHRILLNATTLDTGSRSGGVLSHQLHANHRRKDYLSWRWSALDNF